MKYWWGGLSDEAKAVLIKQGWGTKIKEKMGYFTKWIKNALHYNPNRFNEMIMGYN